MSSVERDKVFISYSHRDKIWLERLQIALKPLVRTGQISLWDDTRIKPGTKWRQEIQRALASAKVAVLLVSQDFLASEFITEQELPPLLEAAEADGLKILWIHVSSALYRETPIQQYQAAHDVSKPLDSLRKASRNKVLIEICQHIKKATQAKRPESPIIPSGSTVYIKPKKNEQQASSPDILADESTRVDLEIHVDIQKENDQEVMVYTLHSPNAKLGFHCENITGPRVTDQLVEYLNELFAMIEKFHSGLGADDSQLLLGEIAQELEGLGRELYQRIFPKQMRQAYRRFRLEARTVHIISSDRLVPWEMMKPYDDSDPEEIIDDDFFCCKFQLTRWLGKSGNPLDSVNLTRIACIEAGNPPGYKPLPHAKMERELVAELAHRNSLVDCSPPLATYDSVMEMIAHGRVGLIHPSVA